MGLDYRFGGHSAEEADFLNHFFAHVHFASADEDVGCDTNFSEFVNAVLGWLGFDFVPWAYGWHHGYVHIHGVFVAEVGSHLSNCFEEGKRFDITDSAADFGDDHIGFLFHSNALDKAFDFVGDVGDDLNRTA